MPENKIITIASPEDFEQQVLKAKGTVLVDFWAAWCGPCRMVAPVLESVAADTPDLKVAKVNVDERSELAARYGVMSIPTLLLFQDGQQVNQSVGALNKQQLLAFLGK